MDTFPMIIGTLTVDKLNYLIFHGYTLKYGSAEIFSVHFDKEFDEEDCILDTYWSYKFYFNLANSFTVVVKVLPNRVLLSAPCFRNEDKSISRS